ncbi:Pycsar system effector family protein, partial [Maribacter dokdonensis]
NWQERKEDNILSLISRLQKAEKTEKKEILKARLKDESPQRAIQSLYRIELRNHIKLSDIADTKANILLSVNAIIISLLLANLLPKLDSPSNSYLIYPTVIFVLFSIASMIMSVLATRPKVDNAEVVENDINKKDTNYLFFGNFHTMEIKDFKAKLRDIIKSKESIYDSLSMDLYYLGKVLQEKYRLLRWTYTVFLVGIILSVIAFGFALKYYGMEDELLDAVTPLPKE